MSAHTPGPWAIFEFGDDGIDPQPGIVCAATRADIVIWGDEGEEAGVHGDTEEQAIANARLIAAAPELLEALAALVEDVTDSDHAPHDWSEQVCVRNARAAIAKATGGAA